MDAPRVAVIMPAKNSERTIASALLSLLSQSRPADVVVVDDGSVDDTFGIATKFAGTSDSIHAMKSSGQGVSAARNTGLRYVRESLRSDYILFMDSDDVVADVFVEEMMAAFEETSCRVVSLADARYTIRGTLDSSSGRSSAALVEGSLHYRAELLRLRRPTSVWAYGFHTSSLGEEVFDPAISIFEDLDFLLRVLPRVSKIGCVESTSYSYEIQDSSVNRKPMGAPWMSAIQVYYKARLTGPRVDADAYGRYITCLLLSLISRSSPAEHAQYAPGVQRLARSVSPLRSRPSVGMRDRTLLLIAAANAPLLVRFLSLTRRARDLGRGGRS